MPRALIGSCLLVLVLYTLLALVISGLMPFDKLANSETPISDALTWIPALGSTAGIFVAITAMIVILGSLSSCVMYQPRLEYAMAKDNLFFKCLPCASEIQHAGCLHHPARGAGDLLHLRFRSHQPAGLFHPGDVFQKYPHLRLHHLVS